jgi:DNA-binding response OmpR family regulator
MIEDDEDILEALRYNFAKEGYQAHGVISAEEGLKIARDRQPDLILLD